MKQRITIDGGAVVYEIECPVRQKGDGPKERAAKSKATNEAQALRNRILSTRVADAKIRYVGKGEIARASQQGWLQRFFSIISPF